MLFRLCPVLVFLLAMPAWAQVEPSATGPPPTDEAMRTPPSVSGDSFPSATGSEMLSNELHATIGFLTSYDDNVLGAVSAAPVADFTYSIMPTISFDRSTARLRETLTYSPNFTLYQRTSARNEADQNANASLQYRLGPHASASVRDSFERSTNVFNQPYGGVTGATQSFAPLVMAPFAEQILNSVSGEASYQFDRNGMIGGGGTSTMLNYPNPTQSAGLFNSNSNGATAFYNLRLTSTQSTGVTYQYTRIISRATGNTSETQLHTFYLFYTLNLKHALSLSVSGGPQDSQVSQPPIPSASAWQPAITASASWQKSHTEFALSYSRTVTGGGGLFGAFHSNLANGNGRWQFSRSWTAGVTGNYTITRNVSPLSVGFNPGGHSFSGSALIQRSITEHLAVEGGYTRLHESYNGIPTINQDPDSNRGYISITYQFRRALGN